jgi:hypothetical protein
VEEKLSRSFKKEILEEVLPMSVEVKEKLFLVEEEFQQHENKEKVKVGFLEEERVPSVSLVEEDSLEVKVVDLPQEVIFSNVEILDIEHLNAHNQ